MKNVNQQLAADLEEENKRVNNIIKSNEIEVNKMKRGFEKELQDLKKSSTEDENLNLTRLRIMLAEEKKEKTKIEAKLKNDIDALKSGKIVLEEELRTSFKENNDLREHKRVLMNVFSILTEKIGSDKDEMVEDITTEIHQNLGTRPKYSCNFYLVC